MAVLFELFEQEGREDRGADRYSESRCDNRGNCCEVGVAKTTSSGLLKPVPNAGEWKSFAYGSMHKHGVGLAEAGIKHDAVWKTLDEPQAID